MTVADAPSGPATAASPRSAWRAVAVPNEHGGWGLTAEPVLLGLLLAPSVAGACLGLAAFAAFLVRTPIRIVLVDRHRGRSLARTRLAATIAAVELALILLLLGVAVLAAGAAFWWPAVIAAPLVGLELSYDMRSRSRRLVPELAGAIGVSAVAAMIVLAGGGSDAIAAGAWLILAARATSAIPHVRQQIAALHRRATSTIALVATDAAALVLAGIAVACTRAYLVGAASIAALVVAQWTVAGRAAAPKVIGIRQSLLGLFIVVAAAAGVHLT
jgi:hypothetical protein